VLLRDSNIDVIATEIFRNGLEVERYNSMFDKLQVQMVYLFSRNFFSNNISPNTCHHRRVMYDLIFILIFLMFVKFFWICLFIIQIFWRQSFITI